MRVIELGVVVWILGGLVLPAGAQEKAPPAAPAPPADEVGIEVKRRLERMEQVRGPKKEVRISPANVEIRIRPPDADPLVDFSYAIVSLTLKKPVQGVREIIYWAYSLSDAVTLSEILNRGAGVEVAVRCPLKGDSSRCWFESFIFR
ncbi:MAG TPA: hypothetical protein VFF51_02225 [Candidatus Methylomirabilis sp.]|nr:hypothetical protein [Candidatus Methylomirabilis sp.]